jgi:predicted RNA binding protein YcfA (HicA-like mRNA interferase family)
MTRLPTLHVRKVVAALKQAGFIENKQRGSHLYLWHPRKKVNTTVPIHAQDLSRQLLRRILAQAGLSEEEFRALL